MASSAKKVCVTQLSSTEQKRHASAPGISKIEITDPNYILQQAKNDPMAAAIECQAAFTTLETGFHDRKIRLMAAAYGIAYYLMADNKKWKEFCKHDFWKDFPQKPKNSPNSIKKSLSFVMKFVMMANTKALVARSNVYAAMLQRDFNNDTEASDIADIIRDHGGIEKMRKAEVERRKRELHRLRVEDDDEKYFRDIKTDLGGDDVKNVGNRGNLHKNTAHRSRKRKLKALIIFTRDMCRYINSVKN